MSYFERITIADLLSTYAGSSILDQNFKDDRKEKQEKTVECDFFFPNACQTCGCMGSRRRLFQCAKCKMISYCSKEHQAEDWPSHKSFCKAAMEIRKKNSVLEAAKDRKQEFWVNAKLRLTNLIINKLLRILTPREQKILKFPRACLVCHETDQSKLVNCSDCPSVSFCEKHKELGEKIHAEKCPEFQLCHAIELEKLRKTLKLKSNLEEKSESDSGDEIECMDSRISISVIKEAPIKSLPDLKNSDSMKRFRDIFSPINLYYNRSMMERLEIADSFTKPLCVYRALEKLDRTQEGELIIHMIGAKLEDLDTYLFWETLLHWIPKLISLKVVLVNQEFAKQHLTPQLCEDCEEKEKKLVFELHNLEYENFMEEKSFSEPSLVVGFKVHAKDEMKSLKSISNFAAPFAFTSDSEKLAKEEHKSIKKILGKFVQYETFEENPFSGRKPMLDFETDGISYEHQFLTIYTNLKKNGEAK